MPHPSSTRLAPEYTERVFPPQLTTMSNTGSTSIATQTLPPLPNPAGLVGVAPGALQVFKETKSGRANLEKFRQALTDGTPGAAVPSRPALADQRSGYNLDPPGPSALPPLPSIPTSARTRYTRPSASPSSPKTIRPTQRPTIPRSSPFAAAECETLQGCVDAVRELGYPACGQLKRYGHVCESTSIRSGVDIPPVT